MSRVEADDIPLDTSEPFGMSGILTWLRPLLSAFCALCAVGCLLASNVSQTHQIGLRRDAPGSTQYFESLFGRFQIQFQTYENGRTSSDYSMYDFPLGNRIDTWQPSPAKTIGIDWGDDIRGFRNPRSVWQIRIRWRTLAILFAVPPVLSIVNLIRRRTRRDRDAGDAAFVG